MSFNDTQKAFEGLTENDSESTKIVTAYPGELYVVIVLLSLFIIIGTAGNGLVLYVFSKKKDTLVSTQCIIALATVDFVTCVLVIPCTIYMEYTDFNIRSDFFCKFYQFLITSSIPFSALIMVAIALDRYLCICHPFLKILTVGRSKVMICTLWLIAGSLGVCVALTFGVYKSMPPYHSNNFTSPSGSLATSETSATVSPLATPGLHRNGLNQNDVIALIDSSPLFSYSTTKVSTESKLDLSMEEDEFIIVNSGICQETDLILTKDFFFYYQKLYNIIFPLCLVIVIVLYVMIYRSVLVRRSKRQKQKSKALLLVKTNNVKQANNSVVTETVPINGEHSKIPSGNLVQEGYGVQTGHGEQTEQGVQKGKGIQATLSVPTAHGVQTEHSVHADQTVQTGKVIQSDGVSKLSQDGKNQLQLKQQKKKKLFKPRSADIDERKRTKADSTRLANIKTAAMLFVVNVVFFVSFMPAFLTTLKFIPFSQTLFYLYFANNVANPVIYSFMNKNFRSDLAKLFGYKAH